MFALPYLLFKLAEIGHDLRDAQKQYTRTRAKGDFVLLVRLETRFDKCLALITEHPDYATHTFQNRSETFLP